MSSGNPRSGIRVFNAIAPIDASTTQTSTGIPTVGFKWAYVILSLGVATATATSTVTIEESATLGGSYTAVTGAAFAATSATSDGLLFVGEIELGKRLGFIRIVATNATAGTQTAVIVVMTGADRTERVYGAQLASSPIAAPVTAAAHSFSV